jgi:hypothetical protein
MGGSKRRRKQKAARDAAMRAQHLAERENQNEQQARLMAEREDDPQFAQRERSPDGSLTIRLPESESGEAMARLLEERRSAFVTRFGREPGPGDPVFFDDSAPGDQPRAWTEDAFRKALTRPGVAEQLGLDPAVVAALAELGYIVSKDNAHLFSAEEVRAFKAAVERHRR